MAGFDDALTNVREDEGLVAPQYIGYWRGYLEGHIAHYRSLLGLLQALQVESVLEVGSFPGHFALIMAQLGFLVTVIDLAPERAPDLWSKHEIHAYKADIEAQDFPVPSESFDAVVFAEVFEHLRVNPLKPLAEIKRVLKPGGKLIFSVPNVSPRHRIKFLLGRDYQGDILEEFGVLGREGHMGHFRLYSHNEVRRILEYAGFEVREERVEGVLPGGRWRFIRMLGPLAHSFRSHYYVLAQKS